MTKQRRIVLLLTQIFMLLGAVLAFYHFFAISSNLSELVEVPELPEVTTKLTAETREWMEIALDAEGKLAITGGVLDVCSSAFLLYGCVLLGGTLVHFLVTPWKLRS